MASFTTLPLELVIQVVENVNYDNDPWTTQATLASLCRTSKVLNSLATKPLYTRLKYKDKHRLILLTRTLIECPELGRLVRQIEFQDDPDGWSNLGPEDFPEEVATLYTEKVDERRRYPLVLNSSDKSWGKTRTLFNSGRHFLRPFIDVDLLIRLCPEVEDVRLYLSEDVFSTSLTPLPPMRSVQKVTIEFEDWCAFHSLMHGASGGAAGYVLLLACPNLEKLILSGCDYFELSPDIFSNLRKLSIMFSDMEARIFRDMLSRAENLEVLEFQCAPDSARISGATVSPSEAGTLVCQYGQQLRVFRLDMEDYRAGWEFPPDDLTMLKWDMAALGIEFHYGRL